MERSGTRIRFGEGVDSDVEVDVDRVAEALSLLGEPVRLRILLALAGTRRGNWGQSGLPYTELREAVDVEDGGRFNHHLRRLRDTFVTDEDGLYVLTPDGWRIANVVFEGQIGRRIVHDRTPIDRVDPADGATLEAAFDDGRFVLWRAGADEPLFDMALPPTAATKRSIEELYELSSIAARQYTELAVGGTCPECWARLAVTVSHPGEPVRFACRRCQVRFSLPAWICCVYHPPIGRWLAEHGYEVDDVLSVYELYERETVDEDGDAAVTVTFTVEEERRDVRLEADGTVAADPS